MDGDATARRRLAWFYALTFVLLGAVPVIHGLTSSGPLDFDSIAARASAATGLAWTSNLLVVLRLCFAEPTLWLLVLGSFVPTLAALIVCATRPSRLRALVSRFRIRVDWGAALGSYALVFGLMIGGLLLVDLVRSTFPGPEYADHSIALGPSLVLSLLTAAFLDQGALGEELGWRGYAQPELQGGLASPLAAAVLIGVAWGLWHVPRDVFAGVIDRLGFPTYLTLYLPSFVAGTVTTSIIAAYFVNRCGGSVIPAVMVHGLGNDSIGFSGNAAMEVALSPYHQATKALPFALIAGIIVAVAGRGLGSEGAAAQR